MENSGNTIFSHKLALIIPTRNRPEILKKLLDSIQNQLHRPDQVIIVDGSDQSIKPQIKSYLGETTIHVCCYPPSLTRQKNEGLLHLNDDITLVGYLDDDIELEPDAVQYLLEYWESKSEGLGGCSFNIINVPPKSIPITFIRRLFAIEGSRPGEVLGSGFCTSTFPTDSNIETEWLCGGATVWRRELFCRYHFDEWFSGWAYHEDADFSYRISKHYRLVVIASAKVTHNPPLFNKAKLKQFGMMSIINRYYFVAKNKELSVLLFFWASLGDTLINLLKSIREMDTDGLQIATGFLTGLFHIVRGDLIQLDENFRK
jgi:glycosyltransferase involved in cell wall biosynthesis